MDDGTPPGGLSPEEMAQLLRIGVEDEDLDPSGGKDASAADLLETLLAGSLPPESTAVDALPAVLARLRRDLLPLEGRPIGEVLSDPSTDLSVLKAVKAYGKRLAARNRSEPEHAAAVAVYYAAIAAALVHHGERITTHSPSYLKASFVQLGNAPWVGRKLSPLLAAAAEACEDSTGTSASPR
jgi:hypothetical protein